MEKLFVGNSVILLFWVYISFIIDIDEYYKKIILMYLITYIANILNIVPTFQSLKKIDIDGKAVAFKASAAIPRIYRIKFQRDIYKDFRSLEKRIGDGDPEESSLNLFSFEMFENIADVMAKHADPSIPDNPEEWLDEINKFSIYQVLPKLIELWGMNIKTDVEAKKTSCDRP